MKKLVFAALVLTLVTACTGGNETNRLAEGAKPKIVAAQVHLAALAMDVAGDNATVVLLGSTESDPHSYEPTVEDRRKLDDAHLFITNGLGLENFEAERLAKSAGALLVDCSAEIPKSFLIRPEEEDHHDHDHGDGHGHGDEEANPHVWLSVEGALSQAAAVRDALVRLDPGRKEKYEANFKELKGELESMRDEFASEFKRLGGCRFASNHDAFPYLAREFGLEQVGTVQATPGRDPGVAERRELQAALEKARAQAVFLEPGFSDSAAKAIAEAARLPTVIVNPLAVGEPAAGMYARKMRENLTGIRDVLEP